MIRVEFLGPIGVPEIEMNVSTLSELGAKLQEMAEVKPWLANSAIAVNDTIVSDKNMPLKDGDKVSILPPVCGG